MDEIKQELQFLARHFRSLLIFVGGLCMLGHFARIGRFPEGIELGEGILLSFVSCLAIAVYLAYWAAMTSTGLWLLRWPMEGTRLISSRLSPQAPAYLPTSFKVMWNPWVWFCAAGAVVLAVTAELFRMHFTDLIRYSGLIVAQGFIGGVLLVMLRCLHFDATGLSLAGLHARKSGERVALRNSLRALFWCWLLIPLFIGQDAGRFVRAAFVFAQIRIPHASVEVAAPWDTPLKEAGLEGTSSFRGDNYTHFDDVTISHAFIGLHTIIEVRVGGGKFRQIAIPREMIEVQRKGR